MIERISNTKAIEMRKVARYRLVTKVSFMWALQCGQSLSGEGITRNINISGVYIMTDGLPPVGAFIQMDIFLPNLTDAGSGMQLYGEGVVLRAEPRDADSSESGFAASVQFYPRRRNCLCRTSETPDTRCE
jgi:hypothetical protein